MKNESYKELQVSIADLDVSTISEERKAKLQVLIDFIQAKVSKKEAVRLNFVCTHNSRRSHMSQIWAQTMAYHFDLDNVACYSAGTEATAMFPVVATTLVGMGFRIDKIAEVNNPVYCIKYSDSCTPIVGFSKTITHPFNPQNDFGAVMTCTHADENCPLILGAEQRISLPFEDPKAFDNTDLQAEKYKERSVQIATEMMYVFGAIEK